MDSRPILTKKQVNEKIRFSNSFTRFPDLMKICLVDYLVTPEDFASLLGEVYLQCDNLFKYRFLVKVAFEKASQYPNELMTPEEREILETLPEEVTIYRGMTEKEAKQTWLGYSWTLKKEVAEFFAFSYQRNIDTAKEPKTVMETVVRKEEIAALFMKRDEYEVICLNVRNPNKRKYTKRKLEVISCP